MMMRTNEVIINNIDGNNVNTVIKPNNCSVKLYDCVPPLPVTTFMIGKPSAYTNSGAISSRAMNRRRNMLSSRSFLVHHVWQISTYQQSVSLKVE
jgi:hypothetical protein